ncbi:coiled-coil domain-containing protein 151 [Senna tora]|uniref:Coiled-coil domain-containing protein 151 n=1 Tax=Senna tora TaxID=362788 RepID=A0A834WL12_9FABA|nr:coiled-coil domain-containing protein 151 [Senna tora]
MYLEKSIINDKIRKRGCSSSSSSSLVRRYRFKRAILVPMWNTRTRSPSMATTKPLPSSVISAKDKDFSVSARKLAATLWEINDLPPSRPNNDLDGADTIIRSKKKKKKEMRSIKQKAKSPNMSDPSYSPIFERMKGFEEEEEDSKRRASHKLQLVDYYLGGFDALSSSNFKEVGGSEGRNCGYGKHRVGVKNHLKEARSGLSTSKKLLKALNQICLHEHQHSSSMMMPLISALRSEVDEVCIQMDQVIQEQKEEVENLMKHFAEEKAAWRRKEREKVRDAISNIAEELEVERKLRRQTERLNKKIAKEMADVKAANSKISKELETEKRAKEILEQICDELAKGIGEDRAKVEELKRESAKVRDEVEKEREMLQFADVLREERVQMKLLEAKYQFEEKNAVLEKLRKELEAYMKHKDDDEDENGDVSLKKIKDLEAYLNKKSNWGFEYDQEKENDVIVGDDVEADTDSDLHSIELKLDSDSRSFKWSYACENDDDDDAGGDESKRVSIESIGRKSLSEKIQWGSICFNKGTNIQQNSHHFDQEEESTGLLLQAQIQDNRNEETENYRPIMNFQRCDQAMHLQESDVETAGRKSKC